MEHKELIAYGASEHRAVLTAKQEDDLAEQALSLSGDDEDRELITLTRDVRKAQAKLARLRRRAELEPSPPGAHAA